MALSTSQFDATSARPVNAVFEQTFLRRAQQMCPYFTGTKPGTMTKQGGANVINWTRVEQLSPTTTALAEVSTAAYGMGRTAATATYSQVTATMAKYGQFYLVTEEVDLFLPNGTTDELVATLGEAGGRSLNQLMRDVMQNNATERFASNVANQASVINVVSVGDFDRIVNELSNQSARTFSPMTTGSQNIGTSAILPAYWAITHPDVAYDVAKMTGFISVQNYAGQIMTVMGEYGLYQIAGRALRFLMTEDASVTSDGGAALTSQDLRGTSKVDIYHTMVYGQEAFGSVGLGMRHTDGAFRAGENTGSFELINKGPDNTADPFNEVRTLAWKAWFTGAALNTNWSRELKSGATDLTN